MTKVQKFSNPGGEYWPLWTNENISYPLIEVDTFPDYRNVINNQGQRGSSDIDIGMGREREEGRLQGHMLVSAPSNICQ